MYQSFLENRIPGGEKKEKLPMEGDFVVLNCMNGIVSSFCQIPTKTVIAGVEQRLGVLTVAELHVDAHLLRL